MRVKWVNEGHDKYVAAGMIYRRSQFLQLLYMFVNFDDKILGKKKVVSNTTGIS